MQTFTDPWDISEFKCSKFAPWSEFFLPNRVLS